MRELTNCITQGPCGPLYTHASPWFEILIENPQVASGVRYNMLLYLFDAAVSRHDTATALRTARKGLTLYSEDPTFRLMESDAYIRLGRLDEAEKNILSLRESGRLSSRETSASAQELLKIIDARRRIYSR